MRAPRKLETSAKIYKRIWRRISISPTEPPATFAAVAAASKEEIYKKNLEQGTGHDFWAQK